MKTPKYVEWIIAVLLIMIVSLLYIKGCGDDIAHRAFNDSRKDSVRSSYIADSIKYAQLIQSKDSIINSQQEALNASMYNSRQTSQGITKVIYRYKNSTDTILKLQDCDSIVTLYEILEAQNSVMESDFKNLIGIMQEKSSLQDSALVSCRSSYKNVNMLLDTAIAQRNELSQVIEKKNKKGKIKKFGNSLLNTLIFAGGILIGSKL